MVDVATHDPPNEQQVAKLQVCGWGRGWDGVGLGGVIRMRHVIEHVLIDHIPIDRMRADHTGGVGTEPTVDQGYHRQSCKGG